MLAASVSTEKSWPSRYRARKVVRRQLADVSPRVMGEEPAIGRPVIRHLRVTLEGRPGEERAGQRVIATGGFLGEAIELQALETGHQPEAVGEAVEIELRPDETQRSDRVVPRLDHRPRPGKPG
ncbi:hypothetical protein HNR46_003950 [Haloferula luteola]|uniref:Uncharacterized protein n=2 Tax=Haloferula luteola TaxID=595692 RepID=A0A840VIS7_9BACT|nr:hypothetical protein [Haloferula luteola]